MTSDPTMLEIGAMTDEQARAYLESIRWPTGPTCAHCGSKAVTRLEGKAHRAGVLKCREKKCRKQFTVTVGTIFHRSHVPLRTWILAYRIVCSSKKGVSALQLMRTLELKSYKTAWHLAHRIRHAMAHDPTRSEPLAGTVEADEVYIGGKPRPVSPSMKWGMKGHGEKAPVVALVERGGKVRAHYVERVTARTLSAAIRLNVSLMARLNTDELNIYKLIGRRWPGGHEYVRHTREYAKKSADAGRGPVHCNSAESFFALFRRGLHGAFHHVSRGHLQRYVDEFEFRWNTRRMTDAERTREALQQGDGVRLTLRPVRSA